MFSHGFFGGAKWILSIHSMVDGRKRARVHRQVRFQPEAEAVGLKGSTIMRLPYRVSEHRGTSKLGGWQFGVPLKQSNKKVITLNQRRPFSRPEETRWGGREER